MTTPLPVLESPDDNLRAVTALLSPYGLVDRALALPVAEGEPRFRIYTSSIGDPSRVLASQRAWHHKPASGNFDGAGGALDGELARLVSIVESLERYSSCSWRDSELVFARERELALRCISPTQWASCSQTEFDDPGCGLVPYDPELPIRWVKAWSLTHGEPVYVPAVAVFLSFPAMTRSERFIHPVSTGSAAHFDMQRAALSGLLEVVERDAVSILWLQRLRVPEIKVEPELLEPLTRQYYVTAHESELRVRLFDATTDFGIPVLYAVQTSDADPDLGQVVAASCDVDPERALRKLYRELASLRIALRSFVRTPGVRPTVDAENSVVGGALLNAPKERRFVFDFLLDGQTAQRRLDDMATLPPGAEPLAQCVERLAARGSEVLVCDLTTDEARQVGMRVVKTLVPDAVPLSFSHRSRYLATPRLYSAPVAMGHPVHPEADINPVLQPFA